MSVLILDRFSVCIILGLLRRRVRLIHKVVHQNAVNPLKRKRTVVAICELGKKLLIRKLAAKLRLAEDGHSINLTILEAFIVSSDAFGMGLLDNASLCHGQ